MHMMQALWLHSSSFCWESFVKLLTSAVMCTKTSNVGRCVFCAAPPTNKIQTQEVSCSTLMAPWLFAASRVCDIGFQQTALMNCRFGREGPEPEVLGIMEIGGENRRFAMGFDMDRKYTNTCNAGTLHFLVCNALAA